MKTIHTLNSKTAKGHYAPAIVHNQIAYISGQLPLDNSKDEKVPVGTIAEQTLQVLKNLENVLSLCESSKALVLKTTVYISDMKHWEEVNKIYGEFFGPHKPARTIVPTAELHFGALIEIDAIAAVSA